MNSETNIDGEINIVSTSESFMYLVKRKSIGYELAEDWMFFWTFYMPIVLILNIFVKGNVLIYKGLLFMILIFAITISRRYIVSSYTYLLANALIFFLSFIISFTLIERIIFLIPMLFCFITSIKRRKSEVIKFYDIGNLLACEILMVICYFIAFYHNLTSILSLINFASINVAITAALYVCISRMASFMELEGEFIKGYSKRVLKMKLSCIAFVSGAILFFIIIAKITGLYKLFDILTSKILAFLFKERFSAYQAPIIQKQNTGVQPNFLTEDLKSSLKYLQPKGKGSYLIAFIIKIAQIIILAVLFLIILYLLFKIFIEIRNFFRGLALKKSHKKEEKEFVISFEDVKKIIKDSLKVKLELSLNRSNSKKIRKMYHKLVKSYKTKGILAYSFNTPIEIESKVREILGENISEVTAIYEKARYSDAECSRVEVDKMKKLLKL